jgi:hypothetical protein
MLFEIYDPNNPQITLEQLNTTFEYVKDTYPSNNYRVIKVTPYDYKHELLGIYKLMSINRIIKGLPAKNGDLPPSPELSSDIETIWKWVEELDELKLNSGLSVSLHSLLVATGCITEEEKNKLINSESIA